MLIWQHLQGCGRRCAWLDNFSAQAWQHDRQAVAPLMWIWFKLQQLSKPRCF
jgi:hypothetical protein